MLLSHGSSFKATENIKDIHSTENFLFSIIPTFFFSQNQANSFQHEFHHAWRSSINFHFLKTFLVDASYSIFGFVENGNSLVQICLTNIFQIIDLISLDLCFICIFGTNGLGLIGRFCLLFELDNKLSCFFCKLFEFRLHFNNFFLQFGDLFICLLESL